MSSNNSIFYFQFLISLIALGFSITMLVVQKENNNIYLPFLTSLVFAWIPSPINTHIQNKDQNKDQNENIDSNNISPSVEANKLMLQNKKYFQEEKKTEEKNIELTSIHIDKIDEKNFIPTILRKDI